MSSIILCWSEVAIPAVAMPLDPLTSAEDDITPEEAQMVLVLQCLSINGVDGNLCHTPPPLRCASIAVDLT